MGECEENVFSVKWCEVFIRSFKCDVYGWHKNQMIIIIHSIVYIDILKGILTLRLQFEFELK